MGVRSALLAPKLSGLSGFEAVSDLFEVWLVRRGTIIQIFAVMRVNRYDPLNG